MTHAIKSILFYCLQHNHTGQRLRVIQCHPHFPRPLLWGQDEQGHIHPLPLTSDFSNDWSITTRSGLFARDPARILGCLLGGAAGDALGAAVEFMSWTSIQYEFGSQGIRTMAKAYGRKGAITDDTQMMLFTAEGLLRAVVRAESRGICHPPSLVHHALLRWLLTQNISPATNVGKDGWLIKERALWARRAPGNTCMNALRLSSSLGEPAVNNSKGCGGVMRVAPCAFFSEAFELASDTAKLTHGHPTGYLAAGLFADILQRIWLHSMSLLEACSSALKEHGDRPGMAETKTLLELVLTLHQEGARPTPKGIEKLGAGWVAEEALAIGLWCALSADSLEEGITMAVNHSGDSDSTGMIAGNLLGLIHGPEAIPAHWLAELELREVITQVAADISFVPAVYGDNENTDISLWIEKRYPGW